ncbi:MAG: bifunctional metallophosphatase/5'-nucleotidase [Candidatus Aminicenantes bacterium]|nr:bifunctional metallophosphatase/5'-nucleotidase [Candidatus Aminicenantes bacterium]
MKIHSIILAVMLTCLASLSSAASQRLTILHSNDVHGHLRPFSYPAIAARESRIADLPAWRDIGGIARRATLAARIRADLAQLGTPVWLVDAGDFYYYSPFSIEYHGKADVVAMNAAGYDFATLGNHEFEESLPRLREMIAAARFAFLCANVVDSASGLTLTKSHEVRQVGEARIGIFGLVENSAAGYPAAQEGLAVKDPFTVATEVVAQLRGPGQADIVILISHCGHSADKRLARDVAGIDVIVGAHSHTRLPQGEMVCWSDELKPDDINGTVIVQAGQRGGELGRLDLLLEKNAAGQWRVGRYQARLIPVTAETPDDPAVAAVLDRLWAPYAKKYDEVIATATADFADRGDDSTQINFIADAVRAEFAVEVEFENRAGVHNPILAGPVTRALLPDLDERRFTIVTFGMRGSEIRRLLQRFKPVASGLRYRMFCGKLENITVGAAPLDDARIYSCAANSALTARLDGFETLEKQDTKKLWSEVVIETIRKARTISPAYDSRRVVIETLQPADGGRE